MHTTIRFASGTLEIRVDPSHDHETQTALAEAPFCRWDARTGCYRAEAVFYAPLLRFCRARGVAVDDQARGYRELTTEPRTSHVARYYQHEALAAWTQNKSRGVVVLPTGAGKTHVAVMATAARQRSTLVVTPTLDLVRQWHDVLHDMFGAPIGIVGGGSHEVEAITVTTYDSAHLHMEHFGNRFGLVVFDECHHLPSETYATAARMCLAPFRLGLTATPERSDQREAELDHLIGPVVYRQDIVNLSGTYLSDYLTQRVDVRLSEEEEERYQRAREVYRTFLYSQGIDMAAPGGWNEFIQRSARSEAGRKAMAAYREQRALMFGAPSKLEHVASLLHQHRADRTILFTEDNATAYAVSRRFLIPIITHLTPVRERSEILRGFSSGDYRAIVTSKVLNEGVDVPAANVAIVISGNGSVREHVQRLGRILRKKENKQATLYELVSRGTTERYTSARRREHSAYQ
jgi:superfamily II DNA or RNA helicase